MQHALHMTQQIKTEQCVENGPGQNEQWTNEKQKQNRCTERNGWRNEQQKHKGETKNSIRICTNSE